MRGNTRPATLRESTIEPVIDRAIQECKNASHDVAPVQESRTKNDEVKQAEAASTCEGAVSMHHTHRCLQRYRHCCRGEHHRWHCHAVAPVKPTPEVAAVEPGLRRDRQCCRSHPHRSHPPQQSEPALQLRPPATPNRSHHRSQRHEACGCWNDTQHGPSVGPSARSSPSPVQKRDVVQASTSRRSKGAAQQATCSSLRALEYPLHRRARPVPKRSAIHPRNTPTTGFVAARCAESQPLHRRGCSPQSGTFRKRQ